MPPSRFVFLAAAVAPLTIACGQRVREGTVAERYAELCANCHGRNLEGGMAQSLLDDVWLVGGDNESLAKSIRDGFPEKGMPAWGATIPEKEIRAMVIYLREKRELHARKETEFNKPKESMTVQSQLHGYRLDTWVGNLDEPYSLAFLPGDRAIVTEKKGRVYMIENGRRARQPLSGIPKVDTSSNQAGLYDVVAHPDYANNGWLYFAYAEPRETADGKDVSLTKVIRGKARGGALIDQQVIYEADLAHYVKKGGPHFGGRIAFDREGFLYFTLGERGGKMVAQDLTLPIGKIHRLHDDGRIPGDNPFVKKPGAIPSIWSYGHRNPQGLAFDPRNGDLYDLEHGPRGGDELNLVEKGNNYGWPVITYGMEYSGTAITDITHKEGMEQPVVYWTPSLAVCGMNFYTGDLFPKWKNHLFITSLAAEELRRLEIRDRKVIEQEVLFKDIGRIRHVITGPDDALYVLLPERIARITPAR
ncbi:MAG: PQQ-dependent sugar dehydrogenase [Opitutaceae bacterium]